MGRVYRASRGTEQYSSVEVSVSRGFVITPLHPVQEGGSHNACMLYDNLYRGMRLGCQCSASTESRSPPILASVELKTMCLSLDAAMWKYATSSTVNAMSRMNPPNEKRPSCLEVPPLSALCKTILYLMYMALHPSGEAQGDRGSGEYKLGSRSVCWMVAHPAMGARAGLSRLGSVTRRTAPRGILC